MKLNLLRTLLLAGATVALPVVPALAAMAIGGGSIGEAVPSAATHVASKFECFTDDGYGRKLPCSYGYKQANPSWRQSSECFVDEGYGRMRPCSANLKTVTPRN